eukprot:gnl/Carplike_NY0171/1639_a2211_946.p1 GENE.gnl/Carplike_NY0171/1639_a2211_946~~gnl/Carplike_NY0171/1639_a2211_946.p1  ORF type:complete len:555 (-),score=197.02 gnl/Carplike_NY0171/1639_a2211_946:34-1650(-)
MRDALASISSFIAEVEEEDARLIKIAQERRKKRLSSRFAKPAVPYVVKSPPKCLDAEQEGELLRQEGNSLFRKGQYDKAIACYSKSIELFPQSKTFTNRAICELRTLMPNYKQVISDCTKALQLDSGNVKAHLHRARSYCQVGKLDEAICDIEVGLKKCPNNVQTRKPLEKELSKLTKMKALSPASKHGSSTKKEKQKKQKEKEEEELKKKKEEEEEELRKQKQKEEEEEEARRKEEEETQRREKEAERKKQQEEEEAAKQLKQLKQKQKEEEEEALRLAEEHQKKQQEKEEKAKSESKIADVKPQSPKIQATEEKLPKGIISERSSSPASPKPTILQPKPVICKKESEESKPISKPKAEDASANPKSPPISVMPSSSGILRIPSTLPPLSAFDFQKHCYNHRSSSSLPVLSIILASVPAKKISSMIGIDLFDNASIESFIRAMYGYWFKLYSRDVDEVVSCVKTHLTKYGLDSEEKLKTHCHIFLKAYSRHGSREALRFGITAKRTDRGVKEMVKEMIDTADPELKAHISRCFNLPK